MPSMNTQHNEMAPREFKQSGQMRSLYKKTLHQRNEIMDSKKLWQDEVIIINVCNTPELKFTQ